MGFLSGIGGILNDITGASSAGKDSYKYNSALANMSYQHQKEFAQNAHQWEIEDLKKAGLNPIISAGGSSAGSIAGGGSTGGSVGAPMANIGITDIVNSASNASKTIADIGLIGQQKDLLQAQELKTIAEAFNIGEQESQTKGGWLAKVIGTDLYNDFKKKIEEARIKRTATSAKRKKELEKKGNEKNFIEKLLTFEVNKK